MKRVLLALAVLLSVSLMSGEAWARHYRAWRPRAYTPRYHYGPVYGHPVVPVIPRANVYYGVPSYRFYAAPPIYGGGFYYRGPGVSIGIGW